MLKKKICYKSPTNPRCIDLFLTNSTGSFQNTTTVATGLSDFHKMILTVSKTTMQRVSLKEIIYRDYKHFEPNNFRSDLRKNLESINNYELFEKIFLSILNKHAPLKKKVVRANHVPYMTKALRKAIMKHSALENKYLRNNTTENKIHYKKQKKFCSRLYKKERKKFYSNLEINNITDNKTFWKTMKPFLSDKCALSSRISLVRGDEIISDDIEIAESINNYYKNVVGKLGLKEYENSFDINENNNLDPIDIITEKYKNHPSIKIINENIPFDSRFSFKEISEDNIKNLNTKKASTFGNIPTKILKDSSEDCSIVLRNIWNFEILGKQHFSQNLKLADVTPVYKKKDPMLAENYRPVSVLPSVWKVFERIIQNHIKNYVDEILSLYLCGYRKGFSMQFALLSLIEKWRKALVNKGYAGAVLMDLSKAFDTINHELLIAKLHAYRFDKNALKLIFSYISDRWQRIKLIFHLTWGLNYCKEYHRDLS